MSVHQCGDAVKIELCTGYNMSRSTAFVCTLAILLTLAFPSASAQTFTQLADYVVDSGWVAVGISGDVSTGVLRRGDTIVRFDAISGVHRDTIILPGLMNLIYIGTSLYAITDEAIDSKDYYVVRRCLESTNVFTPTTIRWPHFEGGGYPYHTRFPKFVVSTSSRLMYVYIQHGIHYGGRPSNDRGYFELAVYDIDQEKIIDSLFSVTDRIQFSANGEEVAVSRYGSDEVESKLIYASYENGERTQLYVNADRPYARPVGTYRHVLRGDTLLALDSLKTISTHPALRGSVQHLAGKGNMWVKSGGNDDTLYCYNLFTNHRVNIDTVLDSRNSSYRFLPFPDQQKFAVIYGGVRVTIHSWMDMLDNDTTILTTPYYRRYQYDTVSLRVITTLRTDSASFEWFIGDTLYATTSDPHVIVRPRMLGEYPVRVRIVASNGVALAESILDTSLKIEQRKGTTVIGHIDGWEPEAMEVTSDGSKMILKTYGSDYEYSMETGSIPWIIAPTHTHKPKYVSYHDQHGSHITASYNRPTNVFDFELVCHRRHPVTLEAADSTTLIDIDMGRVGVHNPVFTERYTTLLVDQVFRDTLVVMRKRSYYNLTYGWRSDAFHISDANGFLKHSPKVGGSHIRNSLFPYDIHSGLLTCIVDNDRITLYQLHDGTVRPRISNGERRFTAVHILDTNTIITNAGVYKWDTVWTKTDSLPFTDILGFVRIPKSRSFFILRESADTACVLYSYDGTHQMEFVGSTIGSVRTFYFDRERQRIYVLDDHNVLHLWNLIGLPVYAVDRPIDTQDDSTDIGIVQRIECYDLMGRLLQRVNGSADNHSNCRGLPHIVIHYGEHGMKRGQIIVGD